MQQMRLDSKEGLANGWAGAGAGVADAHNLPERARAKSPAAPGESETAEETPRRGWISGGTFRFARNALAGLLLVTAIPVGIVGWRSQHLRYYDYVLSRSRVELLERLRPLMAPKDASITPMQAGQAFHALQSAQQNEQFPMVPGSPPVTWPWRTHKLSDEMFRAAGGPVPTFAGPPPQHIVEIAPGGFSPAELAWLREVAEAPVWKYFDVVASAPAVDMIGGQFQLPFRADAFAAAMPIARFAGSKELAYASMSRAAYYLATGEPAKSEAVLRSVVSFGFAMIDNANSAIDALVGGVIVNIGRNGLAQFYLATNGHNPLTDELPSVRSTPTNSGGRGDPVSVEELHRRLLKAATDPRLPRGMRLEQLNQLSFASCTNIPEMIFGPNAETREAFADARKTLARYPSEQALLDLMLDATNRVPEKQQVTFGPERFLMGAAVVASTVTNNPRFATCTRIALSYW